MSELVVVNSSPVILLARIGQLDLLRLAGDPIHIPESVAAELQVYSDDAAHALARTPWLIRVPDAPWTEAIRSWDLGPGESSVLAWASAQPSALAVIDDFAARKCAEVLGIPVKGTLGLVLLAKRQGRVPKAKPLIEELHRNGLYLSKAVIEGALRMVKE